MPCGSLLDSDGWAADCHPVRPLRDDVAAAILHQLDPGKVTKSTI